MIKLFYKLNLNQRQCLHNYVNIEFSKDNWNKIEDEILYFIYEDYSEFFIGLKIGYQEDTKEGVFKVLSKNKKLEEEDQLIIIKRLKDNQIESIETNISGDVELVIQNLIDYVSICKHIDKDNILYRGQSNKLWDLTPSVFRNKKDTNNEKQIFKDLLQWNDNQFSTDDFIVNACNMQHYGIPTRLLDWTSNPLQALFFACSGSSGSNIDGQVIMLKAKQIFDIDTDEHGYIKNFIEYRYKQNCKIDNINQVLLTLTSNDREHLFFRSLYSNDRVKTQQGYFSIYLDLTDEESQDIKKLEMKNILNEVYKQIQKKAIPVNKDTYDTLKTTIINNIPLREKNLDDFINKAAENMEMLLAIPKGKDQEINITDILKTQIENAGYHKLIQREHNMQVILEKEKHIKIIIEQDIKKNILEILDSYGVNSRSIYPDIEGLSKYMRERYQ